MAPALANTECRARKPSRPERTLVQSLDRGRVSGGFRQYYER